MVFIFTGCDIYGGKLIVSLLCLLSANFAFSVVKKSKKFQKRAKMQKFVMYNTKTRVKLRLIPLKVSKKFGDEVFFLGGTLPSLRRSCLH